VAGYLIVLVVLVAVFMLITGPLRSSRHGRSDVGVTVADLQAARDSKYQEIRDAEMDMRTGKLSDDDYAAMDQSLRAEAIEILNRLDVAESQEQEQAGTEDDDLDPEGPGSVAPTVSSPT
jgi:type II secretory pathway component PulM